MVSRKACTITHVFEIGNTLRETRLRRRINLIEAEQDTKIRSKYLGALEAEDFDILPGAVYIRGFLRTYARYLGLEPQLFIDEYNARFGQFEDADDVPVRRGVPAPDRRRRISFRAVMIISLAALAGIAWLGLRDASVSNNRSAERMGVTSGGTHRSTNDLIDRHNISASTSATTATPASADAQHEERARTHGARSTTAATTARLSVAARGGATWIEVRRDRPTGDVVFVGNIAAGSTRHFSARRLIVTVGAPSFTVLKSNGARVSSDSASAERWIVDLRGIRPLRSS